MNSDILRIIQSHVHAQPPDINSVDIGSFQDFSSDSSMMRVLWNNRTSNNKSINIHADKIIRLRRRNMDLVLQQELMNKHWNKIIDLYKQNMNDEPEIQRIQKARVADNFATFAAWQLHRNSDRNPKPNKTYYQLFNALVKDTFG